MYVWRNGKPESLMQNEAKSALQNRVEADKLKISIQGPETWPEVGGRNDLPGAGQIERGAEVAKQRVMTTS
jgi:hypothetical protein